MEESLCLSALADELEVVVVLGRKFRDAKYLLHHFPLQKIPFRDTLNEIHFPCL